MKKLFIIMLGLLTLSSCEKESERGDVNESSKPLTSTDLEGVARMMSSLSLDEQDIKFILDEVNKSLEVGFDEDCRFTSVMMPTKGIDNPLKDKILQYYSVTKSSNEDGALEDLVNCKIYWPNAEDWDGVSMPVITFVPENDTQDWNYGFRQVTSNGVTSIESFYVDEEYVQNNSVWVISIDNKESSEGLLKTYDEPVKNDNSDVSTEKDNYAVYIDGFLSTEQHDSWLRGGSEYEMMVIPLGDVYANYKGGGYINSFAHTICGFNVTRKEIRKKKWQYFDNNFLTTLWDERDGDMLVFISEDDTKFDMLNKSCFIGNLLIIKNGTQTSVGMNVGITKGDEELGFRTYSRSFILSSNGGESRSVTLDHGTGISYKLRAQKY